MSHECPGLTDTHSRKFEKKLYIKYEGKKVEKPSGSKTFGCHSGISNLRPDIHALKMRRMQIK
jgi:hypothetical protein